MTKIALIGSAPSSVALAPYADPSWNIWACSPGARPFVKRVDRWFEMHIWDPTFVDWNSPEYDKFLKSLSCPVMTLEHQPSVPGSVPYPKEQILEHYGPGAIWFYTSSLSWMFALALTDPNVTEIGLWGVDMSAAEEVYTHQRAGCHYWIGKAMERGIKVTIPGQSDLMRPAPLYGFCELEAMHQKLRARAAELDARIQDATNRAQNAHNDLLYLRGAREDVTYMQHTWIADQRALKMITWYDEPIQAPAPPPENVPAEPSAPSAGEPADTGVKQYWESASEPAGEPKEKKPIEEMIGDFFTRPSTAPSATWGSTPAPDFINGVGA